MLNKILHNKKFKYGSAAAIFTAIFVAIVLLLNGIISALGTQFSLYTEISGEKYYSLSDTTKKLISEADDDITIVFFADKDLLIENSSMEMIVTLAEKYASEFNNVSVRYVDLVRNNKEARALANLNTDSGALLKTDVIIRSEKTGKVSKPISGNAFFTVNDNNYVLGFNGERRFTESILAVTNASEDKVAFITGHGEAENLVNLSELLVGAGYDQSEQIKVDLSKNDIPENTKLVIINNPKLDFLGGKTSVAGGVNEIEKLNNYLKSYGTILVLLNNETGELNNLSEFLSENGISYTSGQTVVDTDEHSRYGSSGRAVHAQFSQKSENAVAARLASKTDISSAHIVMNSATPIKLLNDKASPVLVSSQGAKVLNGNIPVNSGTQTLLAVSSRMDYVNNEEKWANLFVSGSTDLVHADLNASTKNADLLRNIISVAGSVDVVTDIDTVAFMDTSIAQITSADALHITRITTLFPAIIVLAVGIYVFIRRKRL